MAAMAELMAESSGNTSPSDGHPMGSPSHFEMNPSINWEAMTYDLMIEQMNREIPEAEVEEHKNMISVLELKNVALENENVRMMELLEEECNKRLDGEARLEQAESDLKEKQKEVKKAMAASMMRIMDANNDAKRQLKVMSWSSGKRETNHAIIAISTSCIHVHIYCRSCHSV